MTKSLTVGVLDGVHLGHRDLLARLDPTLTRTVISFDPHPVEVLRPGTDPRLITDINERIGMLLALGIDEVDVLDLADVKEVPAEVFVSEYLVGKHQMSHIVIGSDFRFGRDRSGDVELLRALGPDLGFEVDAIDLVKQDGEPVSSSRIRQLIAGGEVNTASDMMVGYYTLASTVVHGDKRGRQIGFPTANLRPPPRKVIPGTGVYACFAALGTEILDAAVNVGYRPTFGGDELLVEAFILNFDADIYGEQLRLYFVERLRSELKFDSVDELVITMRNDVDRAREILGVASSPNMS